MENVAIKGRGALSATLYYLNTWNTQAILAALEDSPEAARKNDMTKSMTVLFKEAELGTVCTVCHILRFN